MSRSVINGALSGVVLTVSGVPAFGWRWVAMWLLMFAAYLVIEIGRARS